ncbi:MAG: serine protease [Betaproteobacteria bacterium]|nr:serine protease [Betaproteobacteria bacterium]MDH5221187.1 serine protease [Betaproteobacteria bacterium]MDH5352491.1 serine protease [Betaproteobacteria bacterium]
MRRPAALLVYLLLLPAAVALADTAATKTVWQLFASSSSTKVYLDRASVREDGEYVHFRMRIEHAQPRTSRNRRHTYKSSESELAGDCAARKLAIVSAALFDDAGARLTESERTPERWRNALNPVGADSLQARLLTHACALARGENPPPPAARAAASARIGAGVIASADGLVLTNHHVVQDCAQIGVRDAEEKSAKATLVGTDAANDLALIKVERRFARAASFRRGTPLQAGESVTVVGFPLAALLGFEPNVAFGYVSAVGGLRGDATRFQISAPIHKGNSGGPILDQSGQVIGIVTSKLDALAVQKQMGDLPQNISFGVKGEVAQAFLETQSAAFRSAPGGEKLENTEVAAIGREVTVLVACRRSAPAAR